MGLCKSQANESDSATVRFFNLPLSQTSGENKEIKPKKSAKNNQFRQIIDEYELESERAKQKTEFSDSLNVTQRERDISAIDVNISANYNDPDPIQTDEVNFVETLEDRCRTMGSIQNSESCSGLSKTISQYESHAKK